MSDVKISAEFEPLNRFILDLGNKIEKMARETLLEEAAELARNLIIDQAEPYSKTGQYIASIVVQRGAASRVVGPTVSYAGVVERGSRPHLILPRSARVLAFDVGGETVFSRRVQHPGTAPREIVARAAAEFKIKIGDLLAKLGNELKG